MRLIHVVVLAAVVYAGYSYWDKKTGSNDLSVSGAEYSENGFVLLPGIQGQEEGTVYVISPPGCPKESAVRARELARDLQEQGIPVIETGDVNFSFSEQPPDEVVERMDGVMRGEIPIVLLNGHGKANPSLEEVVAEFRDGSRG